MRRPYLAIVLAPGLYHARGGLKIMVHEIKAGSSFPVKGAILKPDSLGRIRRKYSVWGLDGSWMPSQMTRYDIIKPVHG